MPPTPTPEADEIETARKMCGEPSYALVEARVNALGDASWADALLDIAEFRGVERKRIEVSGEVSLKPARTRKELRRDMRIRLGFDPRTDDERTSLPGTVAVERELRW
jgi:hypothetical protein